MKKNIIYIICAVVAIAILALGVFLFTGIGSKSALEFKKEYEALNGEKNKLGKEHRTIKISKNNPFVKTSPSEIVKKIENKETFYLYVGDPKCPWCRSVLEKAIEVAKKNKVKTIYTINIWDEEGNEILRDKYELKDGKPVKVIDGTQEYGYLLKAFDNVLSDYTLTEKDKIISVGEKRIYAPNFFYIKDGKAVKMVEGTSERQTDPRQELSKEMLEDEEKTFTEFFKN